MAFGKFGRYYPDGADVRIERVDLVRLLGAEVETVAAGPGAGHGVRFETELPSCFVETDAQHMRYIVVNLLHNAVKYSAPGTTVEAVLEAAAHSVELRVRDEGIGIPPADVDALFSPFFRASNVAAREGTGMGLAIVKKSAQLIGARVEVDTTVGEGTTFTLSLPLAARAPGTGVQSGP